MKIVTALWVTIALLCAPLPAALADAPEQQAKELFRDGISSYKAGQFESALTTFNRALSLTPHPPIILNVAQCLRRLDRPRQALTHYRLYLTAWAAKFPGKPVPYREDVETWIRKMEVQVQQLDTGNATAGEPQARAPGPGSKPVPKPAPPPALVKPQGPAPITRPGFLPSPDQAAARPQASTPLYKRWWLWTIVGVAVAGGVTAAAVAATTGGDGWIVEARDGRFDEMNYPD